MPHHFARTDLAAARLPGNERVTLVHNGRPQRRTTDDRLTSIETDLQRLSEAVAEVLAVVISIGDRMDNEAAADNGDR